MNPVRQIQNYNAGREAERLQLKYKKMRESAFVFLRGSCHLFYARLPKTSVFRSAPPVWCCGDLHIENFGSYKGDNRQSYFDANDFDESALAPASWDLVRVLCSLRVAADSGALGPAKAKDARALMQTLLHAYADTLAASKAYWIERDTAQGPVKALLDGLRQRKRQKFIDERTETKDGRRMLRVDNDKALKASRAQREAVKALMGRFAKTQPDPRFYKVLDVARRIAGTGSLGLDRYVVLVQGKGSPDNHYLLDLKRSLPSSLLPHLRLAQPRWPGGEAARIVELQQRLQAVPLALLHPVKLDGQPFVLRELQPSEDRVALDTLGRGGKDFEQLVATMGRLLAWAQLRSAGRQGSASADELIDFGQRKKWRGKLLDAAMDCADQVQRDAHDFNQAYDDGVFAA
ncbi:DUF2252 domain-containing protein [Aquabacterium sp.]|uniref:DUF2252 domain-containing protein n=1 Tax=Aquabacterium sp. TaxID=1872578 RepID=UPI002CAA14C5|nr:DUF2252 domain-containing protein [Aquabacterium sp.]HSW07462.1 DUF2252 domain-containing protein [Aquabacterium sp.]